MKRRRSSEEKREALEFEAEATMKTKKLRACSREFPGNLVFDVLSRLPAKSLMRFKSASKLWRSLISDPLFVKAHQTRSLTRSGGSGLLIVFPDATASHQQFLFATHRGKSVFHHLNLPLSDEEHAFTQVVDGLICFHSDKDDRVSICNITTHEIVTLPQSTFLGHHKSKPHYYLGFDPVNGEYKVLNVYTFSEVVSGRRRLVGKCEILALGRDSSWRRIDDPPHVFHDQSVCFNGLLHWLVNTVPLSKTIFRVIDTGPKCNETDQAMVFFDLNKETFRVMSPPVFGITHYSHIVQAMGNVALASTMQCSVDGFLNLEVMHSVMWVQVRCDLPPTVRKLQCYAAVGNIPTGEVLVTSAKLTSPLPVFYCDPLRDKWYKVEIGKFPPTVSTSHRPGAFQISHHVENIVPLRDLVAAAK